jgi:hypothetical protein
VAAVIRAVLPAPYWGQPGHLGCVRVERFIRWLRGAGAELAVIRAGSHDRVDAADWGSVVTIRDPIGFYRDLPADEYQAIPLRRQSRMRRFLAYLLLVPDPLVTWSRRVVGHPLALESGVGASWVVASSPPESVHLAAVGLANALGARLAVDLRDGWLDEPMIPLLGSRLQQLRHGRLESRVLRRADRVLVSSGHWRRLLTTRLPFCSDKTVVRTNAYPPAQEFPGPSDDIAERRPGELSLLYTGKLQSSRAERRSDQLFEPLLAGLARSVTEGRMVFVGNLIEDERRQLARWDERVRPLGWRVEIHAAVSRERALALVREADGLLLLSSSMASIPAKLFDYLPSGRPVLAVAPADSAVAEIAAGVRQLFPVDLAAGDAADRVCRFLDCCRDLELPSDLPPEFKDEHLRELFLEALDLGE